MPGSVHSEAVGILPSPLTLPCLPELFLLGETGLLIHLEVFRLRMLNGSVFRLSKQMSECEKQVNK